MHLRKIVFSLLAIFAFTSTISGQVYSEFNNSEIDTTNYNYLLPIFGKKVHALGFDLPYSAGISVNYLTQKSNISISNVSIGFNHSELINVDNLIQFNETSASSNGINIRPDIWIFPFLNVYAIIANANTTTNVDVSIVIPRINESEELFSIQTSPNFNTTTAGFGITPTAGFFTGWIALDMNFTWTDVDAQEKPVYAFVFDPRIGKTFNFNKPERNISLWIGGFRVKVSRDTKGSLALNEIIPIEQWDLKVTNGQIKVAEAQIELDTWWDSLSPIQQSNPVNIAKKEGNQLKLNTASKILNGAENAIDAADTSTLQYTLDKKQETMWNFVVGSQFQLNKHWMIRAEYGYSSGREQFFGGIQYRFGL